MPLPPNRMDYLPMIDRPIIKWPNNARVAFWVAPNVEHYEYLPPLDGVRNPWPRTPLPDVQQYSLHEYGNRVGFWRVLEVLDRYQIRCSTTLNVGVLQHFPEIADAMLKRDWTFVNHGFYNTRYITAFSEEQEREFFQRCRETFKRLDRSGAERSVGPCGLQHRAHPRHRRRGRLHLSDRLEDRRSSSAHQGQVGPVGVYSLYLGVERRPSDTASLRGRLLRQDL